MKNPFRKKEPKLLINAIFFAEKRWPNNLDYGNVIRIFVNKARDQKKVTEEELYDLLMELSEETSPCRL